MLEFTFDISDALAFKRKREGRALKMVSYHTANKAIQRVKMPSHRMLLLTCHEPGKACGSLVG